jgi:putative phosphoserine phosphatase/1-acylglycerol-3-phosphate O-acyltransferase
MVHVDVLPSIDTSSWSVDTIDEHVAEVRNTFARVLSQPELSVGETAELHRRTPDDLKPEVRGERKKQRPVANKVITPVEQAPSLETLLDLDEQEAPATRH